MNRQIVIDAFGRYTDAYNSKDEKIRLKIEHTYFVAKLSDAISESLNLTNSDKDLAWLIGMLHDIGRFEQVKRYNTFSDAKSVDHAEFGADLLFQENLIAQFQGQDEADRLTPQELALVELAIRQHNKFRVCQGLSDRELMFCNIIRDADKIDILRVNVNSPMEVIYGVSTKEIKESALTPEVLQCFEERHCVLRALKKTPIDHLVGHISLVFELVYPISRKLTREQGYLTQMLAYESENPETRQHLAMIQETMLRWLEE